MAAVVALGWSSVGGVSAAAGAAAARPQAVEDGGWVLSTTDPTSGYSPTFIANGSLGARIPAAGQGYATSPVEAQSRLAGFFADNGDVEVSAQIPAWTTLALFAGGATTGNAPAAPKVCLYGASCQAADGVLTGGADRVAGGWVEGFADAATHPQIGATATLSVQDVPSDGTAMLTLSYGTGVDDASLTVDGADLTAPVPVPLPGSGGWATWATVQVDIPVHAGTNEVAVSCSALNSSCRFNLEGVALSDVGVAPASKPCTYGARCEAEDAALTGGTSIATDHTGYTGTGFVQGFAQNSAPHPGSTATFQVGDVPEGAWDVQLRYADGLSGAQTLSLTIDGGAAQRVTLPSTGSWDAWGTVTVPHTFLTGDSTIAVACLEGDSCQVNLDAVAVTAPGSVFLDGGGMTTGYRQSLDMRTGTVSTEYDWHAPDGRAAHVAFQVVADRADPAVGVVRLAVTPQWTGTAQVIGQFDGTGTGNLVSEASRGTSAADRETYEELTAATTGVTAGLAARLEAPSGATVEEVGQGATGSAGQSVTMPVTAGQTYTVTKYVGAVVSHDDVTDPLAAARAAAQAAASAGFDALTTANAQAWARLWESDIEVDGDPVLQEQVRASEFYLLSSTREGSTWSLSPGRASCANQPLIAPPGRSRTWNSSASSRGKLASE